MKLGSFGRSFVVVAMFILVLSPAAGTMAQSKGNDGSAAKATAAPKDGGKPIAKATPTGKKSGKLPPGLQEQPGQAAPESPQLSGGPDEYGYSYTDSNEGGVTYNWIDVNTPVSGVSGEDDGHATISTPFQLHIYGSTTQTITVSSNGFVHLNNDYCATSNTQCNYQNTPLPNTAAPNGTVAPYWDDFAPNITGDVWTGVTGTSPNQLFVIEWHQVPFYVASGTSDARLTFEVIFSQSSNDIVFQYQALDGIPTGRPSPTVGIQNLDRTIGLQYDNATATLAPNLAIRYYVPNRTVVTPSAQSKSTAPGATVRYTTQLINQTGAQNTYTLSASNSQSGFTSTIQSGSSFTLGSGITSTISVDVAVAQGTALNTSNVTTLQITAADNSNCTNSDCGARVLLTTTVNTLGVGFSPGNREGVGSAGQTITYTTALTNQSGIANSFTLTLAGNSWDSSLVSATTPSIAANATTPVVLHVTIPANVALGARDTVTVTARSTLPNAGAYSGQLVLTTVAGNWSTSGFMHSARSRFGLADYPPNGNLYALGGEGGNNSRDLPIEEYQPDARSGSWTTLGKLGTGVSNVSAATIGDLIYVPGGYDGTQAVDLLQTYNPQTNITATVTTDPLPHALFGYGLTATNGKLYLIGGSDMSGSLATVYVYDPTAAATHRWSRKADMPTSRAFLALAVLNGKIYATGGVKSITDLTDLSTVEVYDPAGDSWSNGTDLAVPRGGDGAAGVPAGQPCGGFLYVVGGGWYTPTATVERYSPETGWSKLANNQQSRRNIGFSYSSSKGLLVSAGGYSSSYSSVTEVLGCGGTVIRLPTATVTATPPPGSTATATPQGGRSATPTPPSANGCNFNDVPSDFWGYEPITWLACRDFVSGYSDGTFRPFNNMTRGQITKLIVLGQGWDLLNPTTPSFSDVAPTNVFYQYIETAYSRGIISGYSDGTFQWANNVTRGQIAKIVVAAVGFDIDTGGGPHFSDVPASNPFYGAIETAFNKGLISGYADGTFRWTANATRAQVAKIVYIAVH